MLAVIVAALLAAAPNTDTVVTADGTRIQGTVVEESPSKGVTIQAADGTLRRFEAGQVSRVEFGDGSVSSWAVQAAQAQAPAPAAAPAPPPMAPMAREPAPAGPVDTVYFLGGGRVRGTVLEESAASGVTIRLLDGNVRRYARSEIVRIEYADGSVSRRRQVPAQRPAAPPAYAPPPAYPSDQPPVYAPRGAAAPLVPLYGAIGLGGTFFGGESFDGLDMNDELQPQAHLALEGGLRLSPALALGLYMDVGAGDVSSELRDYCDALGTDCTGTSGRIGFLIRHTWNPTQPVSQWLSLGTGWEFGSVTTDDSANDEIFTYTGREYLRLGGGFDFRSNAVLGVGFYGSVAWGEYDEIDDSRAWVGPRPEGDALHSTVQFGLRLTLFP